MYLYVGGLRSADAHVCLANAAVKKAYAMPPHLDDHQVFWGIQTRVFTVIEQMIYLLSHLLSHEQNIIKTIPVY